MPRPRLLSISIRRPWVPARFSEVRAGPAVLVCRDPVGTPIAGLHRAPTPIYYGKFPDSENSNIGREWVISQYWKSRFFLCATMLNSKFAMASSAKKPETSFETAIERLEKIVEEMESGKMLPEDLLVRYEEGMKLVKVCQDRLAHAEQKIQIITRDHAGKTSVKDFAAAEPPIAADSMEEKDNDN